MSARGAAAGYRPILPAERQILSALLAAPFPGNEALRAQLSQATARPIDGDGSLEFSVPSAPAAQVARRIPVEAEMEDQDGVTIHILLHVVDGYVNELEVYRDDSAPVAGPIRPDLLRVIVL